MRDSEKKYLLVGLGISGVSVARYLDRTGVCFEVLESNQLRLQEQQRQEPALKNVVCHTDELSIELLRGFDCVVVSPGVSVRSEVFVQARAAGVEILGDVELFAREVKKPVLAVTGSNGKSTVVSMAGELLKAADINSAVVGNVGVACLDCLADESIKAYVLELSSFQLETTSSLQPTIACVLNVSADHLDRYDGIEDYAEVKRSIYRNASHVVFNLDDEMTRPANANSYGSCSSFSAGGNTAQWRIEEENGESILSSDAVVQIPASVLRVDGVHNQVNGLAAMALASVLISLEKPEIDKPQMESVFAKGFANFTGLPHRTKLVCEYDNVRWINDSKGTNVGATVSAITGMSAPVILIAGGRGKNADYQPLREVIEKCCAAVVLIGEDAVKIETAIGNVVPVLRASSMAEAVRLSAEISKPGDCVLLSPACASFDMFKNFEERGVVFETEVKKLCA